MGRSDAAEQVKKNIAALRAALARDKKSAYLLPSWDEYFSEFTPAHNDRLCFLTGFTGSHGLALVGMEKALFFTDGRYTQQAKQQLDPEIFTIIDVQKIKDINLKEHMPEIGDISFNPKLFTSSYLKRLKNFKFEPANNAPQLDYIDQIWTDRPAPPAHKIWHYGHGGKDAADKVNMVRENLRTRGADWILLCSIDSTSWLLNLRGSTDTYSPFAQIRALISQDEILLFTDGTFETHPKNVQIMCEDKLAGYLRAIGVGKKVMFDPALTSFFHESCIAGIKVPATDPCQPAKLIKEEAEIKTAINCNLQDSIALCEAFAEIESASGLLESDVDEILLRHRRAGDCKMESFAPIVGFKENSAIIHYRADKKGAKKIEREGILLIDSGGHYDGGTTDVTRTLYMGSAPSHEQKTHYTLVLKGHLALARAKFTPLTTGAQLDFLARQFLYNQALDYPHSTGHGVGNALSVHEGGAIISCAYKKPIKPGMILSNEPGYYAPGRYGIRIENLLYCRETANGFLEFVDLTLVPYCLKLIDKDMLEAEEKRQIANYYKKINDLVSIHLSDRAKAWIEKEMGGI